MSFLMLPTVQRGRIRYIGCQAIVWRDRREERLPFVYCHPVSTVCKPTIAVLIMGTTLEYVVAPRLGGGGCDIMLVAVKGKFLELSSEIGTGYHASGGM